MTNTPLGLQRTPTTPYFTPTHPEPPIQVLDYLVNVYRDRIHLQPLPLFNLGGLRARLAASPQFLRWSFLALTLSLSSHDFYRNRESDAGQLYARCAEDSVMRLAAEGSSKLDVIVSSCILALRDLIRQQPARAWMKIGSAARLETMRIITTNDYCDEPTSEDISARCYWSVYILETALSPQVLDFSAAREAQDFPLSAPWPPPLPTHSGEDYPPDLHTTDEVIKDLGINAYSIKMISIWGKLTQYLRQIRAGHIETPWSPESTHTTLSVNLYEYDTQLAQKHLLRNVCFTKRSTAELLQQQEYWRPWITMQVFSHAIPAILNHPFIHLVAMRGNCGVPQSRLFLQQTVDMALFHSGWVFRLIQTCEDLQFEISDPLIAHAVAATATIPWLFQFARDHKVSKKAYEDLGRCERFLSRISNLWPHISRKLEILQRLQSVARDKLQNIPGGSTMISFQPQMFWELLDPKICQMVQGDYVPYGMNFPTGNVPDARLRVTTHFVHPLVEDQEEQPPPINNVENGMQSISPDPEDLEQVCLDQIFYHFPRDESYWLQF
ncbi:hypothetical protein BBP40_000940 [Aspergillus hancockii]|nr:hypothetical protein BBP40_000940 [Aspergillus hancockii]